MEFGKLTDISSTTWTLPQEDINNSSRLVQEDIFKLYFGAPAWGSKTWIGKIYPIKTSTDQFLHYYSQNFNCIELNTTHYRIPTKEKALEWLSKVPTDFRFCPKIPKEISHAKNGLTDNITLKCWSDFLENMQPNLGPCFIQFHELFSYQDKKLLFYFLEQWPSEFRLSIELRHDSWFQNGVVLPALADYLNRKNIGLVITDVAGRRDVLHSTLSTNWTMIRLIGNNLDPSDAVRLKSWALRIRDWKKMGLKDTFLFLHQPDDIMTIEFSTLAEEIFTTEGFSSVPHFTLQGQQNLLSFL